jgi:hypothetical protein
MSQMSNYLENKLVDHIFRGQTFAAPATLHVALYTAIPNDAGGGTEVSTSGTNYARAAVTCSLANWAGTQSTGSTTASTGTGGVTSNNAAIVFNAPGGTAWGSIVGFGIFDAATGGNLLLFGSLSTAKTVNANDAAPQFNAAQMTVTFA